MEKKTKRQIQAEAMREKLQTIVLRMSKTKTLDEIKIRDIAKEAEISVGNFYQYFPTKEAALLYSYKVKDGIWQTLNFEKITDPLERLQRILVTHFHAMVEESLCFDAQLYIAQLKHYDEYFFSRDRYFHVLIESTVQEAMDKGLMKREHTAEQVMKRLLRFSRGLVYTYCTEHNDDAQLFLDYALECQQEYMTLFVIDPSLLDLKKHLKEI